MKTNVTNLGGESSIHAAHWLACQWKCIDCPLRKRFNVVSTHLCFLMTLKDSFVGALVALW